MASKGIQVVLAVEIKGPGRPRIPANLRHLIATMGAANRTWGEERIAAELLVKLALARHFAAHLAVEFPAVFTFLLEPDGIDATDWRAEHALRPAVVTRKVCGGNRSARGAQTQQILASVLQTIHRRELDATPLFDRMMRCPWPTTVLAPPTATALH